MDNYPLKMKQPGDGQRHDLNMMPVIACCDEDEYFFEWGFNPDIILPSKSLEVYVEGGCPDYSWSTDDAEYTFANATTSVPYNTLIASAGAGAGVVEITVTDDCANDVTAYVNNCPPVCATPRFSEPDGPLSTPVTITSNTAGATIRYTTDGSIPDEDSTEYTVPILVWGTLRARAYKAEFVPSSYNTAIYTMPYSEVITVGPVDKDYTSPSAACTAALTNALILIYPDAYTDDYLHNTGGKNLYIRGVDADPLNIEIASPLGNAGITLYSTTPDASFMIVENIYLRTNNAGSAIMSLTHITTTSENAVLQVNKCKIQDSYVSAGIYLGTGYGLNPFKGTFKMTYSDYFPVNFYHISYNHGASSMFVEISTTELNKPYVAFGSDALDVLDIVATPTVGYGYAYGDFIIGVPDGY